MVLQPWSIALAGLLLLAAGFTLPLLARAFLRRMLFSRRRLRLGRAPLRLIRRVLTISDPTAGAEMLRQIALPLQESILLVRQALQGLPALPMNGREIRLMLWARSLAADTSPTADSLLHALQELGEQGISGAERGALPLAVSLAHIERLSAALQELVRDDHDRRKALRLARRLARCKAPVALLTRRSPSLSGVAALLQQKEQPLLLEAVNEWLGLLHTNAAEIIARNTQRQLSCANVIQEVSAALKALRMLNWQEAAEAGDPLHLQLLEDPAQLYPRMTCAARASLRRRTERLAQIFHTVPGKIVASALFLCKDAEPRSLERYVGFYLSVPEGLRRLQKHLGTHRGLPTVLAARSRTVCIRLLLWGFSLAIAFPFLHSGHPLGMLPAFLIVAGCLPRAILRRFLHPGQPPALALERITPELRTLVVLPARPGSPAEALRMLHCLSTARHAIRAEGVDFLLLGDHEERVSQVSSHDAAVHAAVCEGAAALAQEAVPGRILYLHRARAFSTERKSFAARGGRFGAVESVCRLIAQGECADLFDCATFSPDTLYRRYAFVLLIDADTPPIPGMLQNLLSAAAHPCNTRIPTPDGARGFSCFMPVSDANDGVPHSAVRLIRPDAYLEAIDDVLSDDEPGDETFLADALAGCQPVPMLLPSSGRPQPAGMKHYFTSAFKRWQMARWLLPWVKGHRDILRNPLPESARFRLRELLRDSLVPLCQCILLLYALLSRNFLLMLIALLLPAATSFRRSPVDALQQLLLLPSHAAIRCLAAFRAVLSAFRHDEAVALPPENEKRFVCWCQGSACVLCALFGLLLPPVWFPALLPIALFAAFPLLLSDGKEAAHSLPRALPDENRPFLFGVAAATWRYFQDASERFSCGIPPDLLQTMPAGRVSPAFSTSGAAAHMLAAVAARELSLIGADEAAGRIARALDALSRMPMPLGLPCRQYGADCHEILDATVDTRACALLSTALMTAAQALRTWLPQLSSCFYALPANLDEAADALDLLRLYDPDAELFFERLTPVGHGEGHLSCYADEALLLSLAACALQRIPPRHFAALSRALVPAGGSRIPLSQHGDLAAYLLPALFLPIDLSDADKAVHLHQLHGIRGLWGRSFSASYSFTPQLEYRLQMHGLQEIAAEDARQAPVFAPYASALALLCAPEAATGCLRAMQNLGALGLHGFCDAIDLSPEGRIALIQTHSVVHQSVILCACAHALANQPLQRFFCAIPAVEACLPLLSADLPGRTLLPAQPLKRAPSPNERAFVHTVQQPYTPFPALLLGNSEAAVFVSGSGNSCISLDKRAVTRFSGDSSAPEGLQLYLIDEDRSYRLTDPALPGETVFSRGAAAFHRTCGSLRTSLTVFADPCGRRILHLLEISNLATVDRCIEAADCLLPDMAAAPNTLEAALIAPQHLQLRSRSSGAAVNHRFICSAAVEASAWAGDALAFLGAEGSLRAPAALDEPMADLPAAGAASCLSFRFRFTIGGRGQARCLFSTSVADTPLPIWEELHGLLELSVLHEQALSSASGLPPETEALLPDAAGAIFCRKHPFREDTPIAMMLQQPADLHNLSALLAIRRWFGQKGHCLPLHVVCTDETLQLTEGAISQSREEHPEQIHLHTAPAPALREALLSDSQLVVHSGSTLAEQLSASRQPFSAPPPSVLPQAGALPPLPLENPGGYGGIDPESGDYLLLLEARQTVPSRWLMRNHRSAAFEALPSGLGKPFDERLLLCADGLRFDPLSSALPRTIHANAGVLHWRTFAAGFSVSLKTALLPGSHAALRSLRIRNLTDQPASFTFSVAARLVHTSRQQLTILPDAAIAEGGLLLAYAAPVTDGFAIAAGSSGMPEDGGSRSPQAVSLSIGMDVPANGSADAAWIAGFADNADDIARAQLLVRENGASAIFHEALRRHARELPPITVKTPEPALDLLMNHVLARQLPFAEPIARLPLLMLTDPEEAAAALIRFSDAAETPEDALLAALTAGLLLHVLPPEAAGHLHLPEKDATLSRFCADALRSAAASTAQHFQAAAAAGYLPPMEGSLADLHRELLNAGDIRLWQGDHYGEDERLDLAAQGWAALAYGDTPRTQKALRTCRDTLFDQLSGLIRSELPDEANPICPGLPGNGGQQTRAAIVYLAALLHLGHHALAWELVHALNPLERCNTPLRSETYAAAPYYLSTGIQTSPASAGRADDAPDDEAAAWLYSLILCQMLGIFRDRKGLTFTPHVPQDWDEFALTLQIGSASWHFSFERGLESRTIDGIADAQRTILPTDDGRIHQIRIPLP